MTSAPACHSERPQGTKNLYFISQLSRYYLPHPERQISRLTQPTTCLNLNHLNIPIITLLYALIVKYHYIQNFFRIVTYTKQMRRPQEYFVYILSSKSRVLYTGITNNLAQRVYQHKQKIVPGFTKKYNINRLVYYETCSDVNAAIAREKEIKGWLRKKKIALIESSNPVWKDLSADWF